MKTEIYTRFFRGGVGTIIYNSKNEIALFKRAQNPVGIWQLQQGGIDLNEDFEITLWRELKEEIGLTKEDIDLVTEFPEWTVYATSDAISDSTKSRLGQAHKWYFLKLKDSSNIDLSRATEEEASDFRWTDFADAINETEDLKKPVYKKLDAYFQEVIISSN